MTLESHLGIEKSKRRVRDVLYCPQINSNIEQAINTCVTSINIKMLEKKNRLWP